jgi:hypothetical protein
MKHRNWDCVYLFVFSDTIYDVEELKESVAKDTLAAVTDILFLF